MDEVDEIPSSGWLKGCANLKITKCVRGTTSIQENAGFAAIRAKRSRAADGFAASLKPVIAEIRAKGAKRRRSPKRCVSHADLIYADLSEANLTEANLSHANLSRAYLIGADLRGAYLSDASLRDTDLSSGILIGAHLSSADLSGGNISGANLIDADLHNADLRDANLDNANLTSTDLNGADLSGANLANARLSETVFADSNLTGVVGLEACFHFGPSVIDHRTMQKSRSLPTPFLRGVGLPERLIEYLPTLLAQAIQYYSCFISYSTKDQEFADRIYADLQSRGVRCWFAPHDLPIGGKIRDEIDTAIRLRDKLLLVLSEHAINSEWVEEEVTKAFEEERKRNQIVLFSIRIDNAVMDTNEAWARTLRIQRNIGDFRNWKKHDSYRTSFERVMRDLSPKLNDKG